MSLINKTYLSGYVHSEVKAYNRNLVKLTKPYNRVMVVMVYLERKFFTTRVVHMINLGKEKIALKTANAVTKFSLNKKK